MPLKSLLLDVVRHQHKMDVRIVISTQEPTVVPGELLSLTSLVIAHRFTSPQWFKHLAEHVPAAHLGGDECYCKVLSILGT
jgi:hypothetical protein